MTAEDLAEYGWDEKRNLRHYRKPVEDFPPLVPDDVAHMAIRRAAVAAYAKSQPNRCSDRRARRELRDLLREILTVRGWGVRLHSNRWRVSTAKRGARRGDPWPPRIEISVDLTAITYYHIPIPPSRRPGRTS